MEKDPKILLFCPISNHKEYIIFDWLKHLKKLTYKNMDVLLIDNSDNKIFAQRIAAEGFDCINIYMPHLPIREKMYLCYKTFREYFLENKYDYWFSLECDVFPPLNVIEHLLILKSRVIGLPYFTFQHPMDQMLFTDFEYPFSNETTRFQNFFKEFQYFNGTVVQQFNTGIGCLLIHNSVLKKVDFGMPNKNHEIHNDTVFHGDLSKAGIPVYIDTSAICRHFNSDWNKIREIDEHKLKNIKK